MELKDIKSDEVKLTQEQQLERIKEIKRILMLNEFYPPLNHGIKGYKGS